jgi:hypothetical protein
VGFCHLVKNLKRLQLFKMVFLKEKAQIHHITEKNVEIATFKP